MIAPSSWQRLHGRGQKNHWSKWDFALLPPTLKTPTSFSKHHLRAGSRENEFCLRMHAFFFICHARTNPQDFFSCVRVLVIKDARKAMAEFSSVCTEDSNESYFISFQSQAVKNINHMSMATVSVTQIFACTTTSQHKSLKRALVLRWLVLCKPQKVRATACMIMQTSLA